jgi:RNA methyltransferase, TrmH family
LSWGLACVSPQDPGNIGAILRTIDAVGASGLLMLDGGVDIYHPTAVRASMGGIFRKQVVRAAFDEFSAWAHANGYQIIGSSAHGSKDYQEVKRYRRPLILLLGEERRGLTPTQAEICTSMLRLPMHGKVTSLNLAVAAGVLLYDMLGKMEGVETGY